MTGIAASAAISITIFVYPNSSPFGVQPSSLIQGIGISSSAFTSASEDYGFKLPWQTHFLGLILLFNAPQVLASYIFLGLSNILSTMYAMAEWCRYSAASQTPAKGLRVSRPKPGTAQRSTYFLSVPYKWSLPPTVCMAVIHILISECLTLAQVDIHSDNPTSPAVESLSYGIVASSLALAAAVLIFVCRTALLGLGIWMRYPPAMPLAGCCSASIAAACQPLRARGEGALERMEQFEVDLAEKRLKWGVVDNPGEAGFIIGHATFSAGNVAALEKGEMYA